MSALLCRRIGHRWTLSTESGLRCRNCGMARPPRPEAAAKRDDAPTYRLVPYKCEPGCCASAGWVGRECFICDDGVIYGGTVEAITQSAEEHAEQFHQRSLWLALVAEVRRLRAQVTDLRLQLAAEDDDDEPFPTLGEPLARHPDGSLNTDPVCVCNLPAEARLVLCPVHYRGEFLPAVES